MKQKSSRGLTEKTEKASNRNAQAHRENVLCPKAPTENASGEKEERLTWGVHMSGLKNLAGARRLRWSPASNHGKSGRSECTKSISVSFRVGGWWTWASGSTTSTATLSPADGGSGDGGELRWCAANSELKRGSGEWMHKETSGKR